MKFKNAFLFDYLQRAPLPLALERTLECELLSQQKFEKPVLDIGCGEGLFAAVLFDEKIDVGIDPDSKELEMAKNFDMYGELICCKGNKIPKPDNTFNTIFSNSVLEHIPEIDSVIREAHRLISRDGNFYVTLPTNFFEHYSLTNVFLVKLGMKRTASKFRIFFNSFWKHYHCYDEKGWKEIFERNGFSVLNSVQYGTKFQCLFNDFLVPFSVPSYFTKKILNRWVLFPKIRLAFVRFLFFLSGISGKKNIKSGIKDGGLIFLHLKKS